MDGKMRLDSADIKFIDTYLYNSGVEFVDIRLEMVDHVAVAIETEMQKGDRRGFYYVFKDYMVKHKAELLKNNKLFLKMASKKVGKEIVSIMFSKQSLGWLSLSLILVLILRWLLSVEDYLMVLRGLPMGILIFGGISIFVIQKRPKRKQRSAVLEQVGLYFFVFYQLINVLANPFGNNITAQYQLELVELITVILVFLGMVLMASSFRILKQFNLKYVV